MRLEQVYYVVHRTNDPEVLIQGKEGPRLYLTLKGAERQTRHWNDWDEKYKQIPDPSEYVRGLIETAERAGPWTLSRLVMTLEKVDDQ